MIYIMKKIINGKKYDTDTAEEVVTGTMDIFVMIFIMLKKLYIKRKLESFSYIVKVGRLVIIVTKKEI